MVDVDRILFAVLGVFPTRNEQEVFANAESEAVDYFEFFVVLFREIDRAVGSREIVLHLLSSLEC